MRNLAPVALLCGALLLPACSFDVGAIGAQGGSDAAPPPPDEYPADYAGPDEEDFA